MQALLHKYETFRLATGHTVKLPMDRGEGQQWNSAPGNIYSAPQKVRWDGGTAAAIRLESTKVIPPIKEPADTKYVKHVRIRSELLSKFWGRDMFLGAHVLLPEGFDTHPNARYPLIINHGHFPSDLGGWRETPPDAEPEVRVQRALQARLLQPHPAAGGLRLLQGVDRAELPARAGDRDPARQSRTTTTRTR